MGTRGLSTACIISLLAVPLAGCGGGPLTIPSRVLEHGWYQLSDPVTADDGYVYFFDGPVLKAYTPQLTLAWEAPGWQAEYGQDPAKYGSTVYACLGLGRSGPYDHSTGYELAAFNDGGQRLWTTSLSASPSTTPVVTKDGIYLLVGRVLPEGETLDALIPGGAPGDNPGLEVLDIFEFDGQLRQRIAAHEWPSSLAISPVGNLYLAFDGRLVSLDSSGVLRWETEITDSAEFHWMRVLSAGVNIIVRTSAAVAAVSEDGQLLWENEYLPYLGAVELGTRRVGAETAAGEIVLLDIGGAELQRLGSAGDPLTLLGLSAANTVYALTRPENDVRAYGMLRAYSPDGAELWTLPRQFNFGWVNVASSGVVLGSWMPEGGNGMQQRIRVINTGGKLQAELLAAEKYSIWVSTDLTPD